MKTFLLNLRNNTKYFCETEINIEDIKASWKFNSDFPLGCERGISNENLKFVKKDREFLLEQYLIYGQSLNFQLILTENNRSIFLSLDFSTVVFDDVSFEVGFVFSELAEKIKEIDKDKKYYFTENQVVKRRLYSKSKVANSGFSSFPKNVKIDYNSPFIGDHWTKTRFDNINELNISDLKTHGFTVNMPISPPNIEVYNSGWNSTNYAILPSNFTSLISWRSKSSDIMLNAKLKINIEAVLNYMFKMDYIVSTFYADVILNVDRQTVVSGHESVYTHINTYTSTFELNQTNNYNGIINLNRSYDIDCITSEPFGAFDEINYHVYLTILLRGDAHDTQVWNGFSAENVQVGQFNITNFEYETTLSSVFIPNVNCLKFNDFIRYINKNKANVFVNECDLLLKDCVLTSLDFSKNVKNPLKISVSELMHDISMLYAVKFTEIQGKYHIVPINYEYETIEVSDAFNIKFTNIENYNSITINKERERPENKYKYQMYNGGYQVVDDLYGVLKNNEKELKSNNIFSGDEIFNIFLKGEKNTDIMIINCLTKFSIIEPHDHLHEDNYINEYFAVSLIIERLAPYLLSFLKPFEILILKSNNKLDAKFSNIFQKILNKEFLMFSSVVNNIRYKPYGISGSIPLNMDNLTKLIKDSKTLKIKDEYIMLTNVEFNFNPQTIEFEGFIMN